MVSIKGDCFHSKMLWEGSVRVTLGLNYKKISRAGLTCVGGKRQESSWLGSALESGCLFNWMISKEL